MFESLPRLLGILALAHVAGVTAVRAEPVAVTDMRGRTVTLPAPIARVVTLPLPAAPTLVALDRSAGRLVGLHPLARKILVEGPLVRLFPTLRDVEGSLLRAGGGAFMPNVEAVAALMPDLVIQRGDLGTDIVAPLDEAGLPTLLIAYGDEDKARDNLRVIGRAIGQAARAEELIAWREAVASRIGTALAPRSAAQAPTVLFLSHGAGRFSAAGNATPTDHAIRLAGGRNLAGDQTGSVARGIEQVLLWDPDVIVLNSGEPALTPASLAADPVLSALRAVRTGRVYKAPTGGYRLEPPNPENPLFWLWMAAILNPEAAAWDLRAAFRDGFARVYGAVPTASEIEAMLQSEANRQSAGYARLVAPE